MPRRNRISDDPGEIRMSFGEHLDELRRCVLRALIGVVAATALCFHFGDKITEILTAPYYAAMKAQGLEPQMLQLDPTESFLQYFKIALEFGLVLSAPWVLYQIWRFVAVGLYPGERRIVRLFAPSSVVLFLLGAAFMLLVVLVRLLTFLIGISTWFPLPSPEGNVLTRFLDRGPHPRTTQPVTQPARIPVLNDDPTRPRQGDIWLRRGDNSLNVFADGERFTIPLKSASRPQFVQPLFNISHYVSFVTGMALAFGLGFQVPIVVVFLIATGIVSAAMLARARRYVILSFAVATAVLTPSPDVGSMLLLMVPMVVLFESGLLIGRILEQRRDARPAS